MYLHPFQISPLWKGWSSITCTTLHGLLVTAPQKSLGISGYATVEPVCFHELCKVPTPPGRGGWGAAGRGITLMHNLKQGKVICSRRSVFTLRFPSQTAWRQRWCLTPNAWICCPRVAVIIRSWSAVLTSDNLEGPCTPRVRVSRRHITSTLISPSPRFVDGIEADSQSTQRFDFSPGAARTFLQSPDSVASGEWLWNLPPCPIRSFVCLFYWRWHVPAGARDEADTVQAIAKLQHEVFL